MQVPLFLFPAVNLKINQGLIFPDQFDVRHTINVAMMLKIDEDAELSEVNFCNLFINILVKATNYLKHLLQKKEYLCPLFHLLSILSNNSAIFVFVDCDENL